MISATVAPIVNRPILKKLAFALNSQLRRASAAFHFPSPSREWGRGEGGYAREFSCARAPLFAFRRPHAPEGKEVRAGGVAEHLHAAAALASRWINCGSHGMSILSRHTFDSRAAMMPMVRLSSMITR